MKIDMGLMSSSMLMLFSLEEVEDLLEKSQELKFLRCFIFIVAAHVMGISGPKSKPNSVEGGFVDQNELRGFVEDGVDIGTKSSLTLALEKIRAELRHECAGKAVNRGILEYL
ncbi:hypothetical protein KY284_005377 [Solanum tuberosum]|nr:hypothetical protein KY284_005377 [Solanum tuberosum]